MSGWEAYSDDFVAALAADAQARTRAYEMYGTATEAPDAEDAAAVAEWTRRAQYHKAKGE